MLGPRGRFRIYRLKSETLQEVDACLAPIRRFWSARVDALERHLNHMAQSTLTKKDDKKKMKNTIDELTMFSMAVSDAEGKSILRAQTWFEGRNRLPQRRRPLVVLLTFPEGGASITLTTSHENMNSGAMKLYFATSDVGAAHIR